MTKELRYHNGGIVTVYGAKGNLEEMDVTKDFRKRYRLKKIYSPGKRLRKEWLFKLDKKGQIIQKSIIANLEIKLFGPWILF